MINPEVLVSAIRERLDEIERVATAALGGMSVVGAGVWTVRREGYHAPAVMANDSAGVADRLGPQDAAHIALHDPSSVLRRVQADRKIVDLYESQRARQSRVLVETPAESIDSWVLEHRVDVLRQVLLIMARGLGIDIPEDTDG